MPAATDCDTEQMPQMRGNHHQRIGQRPANQRALKAAIQRAGDLRLGDAAVFQVKRFTARSLPRDWNGPRNFCGSSAFSLWAGGGDVQPF